MSRALVLIVVVMATTTTACGQKEESSTPTLAASGTVTAASGCSTTADGRSSGPESSDAGRLVVVEAYGSNSTVSAVRPGSTEVDERWTFANGSLGQPVLAAPSSVRPGRVYVTSNAGQLTVFTPDVNLPEVSDLVGYSATPVIAPSGTPNAGSVFVPSSDHTSGRVAVLEPGGTTPARSVTTGPNADNLAVAPADTSLAGTVYVVDANGVLWTIAPGAAQAVSRTLFARSSDPTTTYYPAPVVAPAGTPNAGTVYVVGYGDKLAAVAPSGATTEVSVGDVVRGVVVAGAGSANAGTVYVLRGNDDASLVSLAPGASTPAELRLEHFPNDITVAPPGTPNAGTVFLGNGDGSYSFLSPGSKELVSQKLASGDGQITIAVAPSGTPNAGSAVMASGSTLARVAPCSGTVRYTALRGGDAFVARPVFAPSGAPNAGTAFLAGLTSVAIVPPDSDSAQILELDGEQNVRAIAVAGAS